MEFYDWQLKQHLLIGPCAEEMAKYPVKTLPRARVWFIVFPNDTVLIRWVGGCEEKVSRANARHQWEFLWKAGGFRTPEFLNKMRKRKEMNDRAKQLHKHYEETGSWKEESNA